MTQIELSDDGPKINVHEYERRVRSIHDYLYANSAIKTPEKIITELSKVFRALISIERESVAPLHHSLSPVQLGEIRRFDKQIVGKVAAAVRKSFSRLCGKGASVNIALSDTDIAYAVSLLHNVKLSRKERDYVGDALESIRTDWVKKHGGQFFTDQKVTNLAMALVRFSPDKGEIFADICCGTGGFLIAAAKYVRGALRSKGRTDGEISAILEDSIFGHELDAQVASIANSTIAGLCGFRTSVVKVGNSLDTKALQENGLPPGGVDCLASNPPFGVKITVKDPELLRQFELAKVGCKVTPKAPDILLLEQNVRMLKPKVGRLAIILPYQLLSGPQAFGVRAWLLKECQVLAVVDLPKETFQPHTGTRTSLVVLRRRAKPQTTVDLSKDPLVFMSTPRYIGHDRRGNPIYKKSSTGSLTAEVLSDFDTVQNDFDVFSANRDIDSDISFACPSEQISADPQLRLNAEFFSPRNFSSLPENNTKCEFVPLKDLVVDITCPGRFKRDYVESSENSVPFLGGSNITELLINTEKYISLKDPKYPSLRATPGTILVTRSGTTGIVSTVPKGWDGYAISEHVIRIRPKPDAVVAGFLVAFFRSNFAKTQIKRGVFGSVIDEITPEHLGEILVPIPKDKKI